jgi:hypothetical protein
MTVYLIFKDITYLKTLSSLKYFFNNGKNLTPLAEQSVRPIYLSMYKI